MCTCTCRPLQPRFPAQRSISPRLLPVPRLSQSQDPPCKEPSSGWAKVTTSARPLATWANDGVWPQQPCNLEPGLGSQHQRSLRERVPARPHRYRTGARTSSLVPGPKLWPGVSPRLSSGIAEGSWGPRMGSLSCCWAKTKWHRTAASRCPTHGRCGSPRTRGGGAGRHSPARQLLLVGPPGGGGAAFP